MARTWKRVVWVLVLAFAALIAAEIFTGGRSAAGAPRRPAIARRSVAGVPRASQVPAGLRLSEILAGPARDWDGDGAFDSRADEWVEVENAGSLPVDLGAYRVADLDLTIRMALSGTLAAGAVRLVTGAQAVEWQRATGRTVTGLSLNNAGDTVRLLEIAGADTIEVDAHRYASIEGASDRSTGRWATDPDLWALFDGLNRYTGSGTPPGTGCDPTPGGPNTCATDAVGTTWGAIKRLYR